MKDHAELTPEELNKLYGHFVVYRDKVCNGHAKMTIHEFYKKCGLEEYQTEESFNEKCTMPYGTYGGY